MASDPVITTGIDKLMEYIEDRDEAEVREVAEALGTDRETIITWANALEDAGLIDIRFSARRGRVLVKTSGDVAEEKMEEVREETQDRISELQELRERESELAQFEDLLDRIEEGLDASEDDVRAIAGALSGADDLTEVREFAEDMEAAESDIEDIREQLDDAIAGLKVLERMAAEQGPEEASPGLFTRIKRKIPFIGGGEERFKCEECGKEFETEHGLKTHEGITHNE